MGCVILNLLLLYWDLLRDIYYFLAFQIWIYDNQMVYDYEKLLSQIWSKKIPCNMWYLFCSCIRKYILVLKHYLIFWVQLCRSWLHSQLDLQCFWCTWQPFPLPEPASTLPGALGPPSSTTKTTHGMTMWVKKKRDSRHIHKLLDV